MRTAADAQALAHLCLRWSNVPQTRGEQPVREHDVESKPHSEADQGEDRTAFQGCGQNREAQAQPC